MPQGMAACNTIIQTIVSVAFVGTVPFGSLLAGTMAHAMGTPVTVIVNGSVVIAAAVWFTTRRRTYEMQVVDRHFGDRLPMLAGHADARPGSVWHR